MTLRIAIALAVSFLFSTGLIAQSTNSEHTLRLDAGTSSPPASIEDMAWLAGYWSGDGFGGHCEEFWGAPLGDRMIGAFSFRRDEQFIFSEATMLVEEEGSLVLKIKHFHPDFTGWEEKNDFVSFPLVRLGEREAFFSGATFRRIEDTLHVYVVITEGEKPQEYAFRFQRGGWFSAPAHATGAAQPAGGGLGSE